MNFPTAAWCGSAFLSSCSRSPPADFHRVPDLMGSGSARNAGCFEMRFGRRHTHSLQETDGSDLHNMVRVYSLRAFGPAARTLLRDRDYLVYEHGFLQSCTSFP